MMLRMMFWRVMRRRVHARNYPLFAGSFRVSFIFNDTWADLLQKRVCGMQRAFGRVTPRAKYPEHHWMQDSLFRKYKTSGLRRIDSWKSDFAKSSSRWERVVFVGVNSWKQMKKHRYCGVFLFIYTRKEYRHYCSCRTQSAITTTILHTL